MMSDDTKVTLADASWLQAKVANQAKALDTLHSKIVRQRFQLRTLNELGRGLTRDEFIEAKKKIENEQTAERIGEPAAA